MNECQVCGCTEFKACMDPFDGEPHACFWWSEGLCSACRYTPVELMAPLPHERQPLYVGIVLV